MKKDTFFEKMEKLGLALTYDDVRLKSGYSETAPSDVVLKSRFSRNIPLHIPIVSAAMDTVTEAPMAIAMAKLGGLGIIHKALTPEEQAKHVKRVKLHLNGLIKTPISVGKNDTIAAIKEKKFNKGYGFNSFPVLDQDDKLVGLLARTDFEICEDDQLTAEKVMTPIDHLVTAGKDTTLEQAYEILKKSKKKILPLLDNGKLHGMYVFSDLIRLLGAVTSLYNVDANGQLRVGAAIGTGEDAMIRADLLVEANCDVLVIDTAHGDSKNVYDALKEVKRKYPTIDVVVGNVSEPDSARRLADAGADGIKVGQGPGSICTTRIIAGIGCPQVTAIYNCAKAVAGKDIPICGDGGIRNSGDIPIALGAGAECVMLGRVLAGTDESPGEIRDTPRGRVKVYRGMGSLGAMQASRASRERYRQEGVSADKLVPEGVEGFVQYQGAVSNIIFKNIGGLRSGMGYVGADSIKSLQEKADFHRISGSGLAESHPHDLLSTNISQ